MVTRIKGVLLIVLLVLTGSLAAGKMIFEKYAWGDEDSFVISPEELTTAEETGGNNTAQERITLDLKGADIREIFKTLSLKSGLAIIPSKEVTGRVNLFLNNVSVEDALDIVLVTQKLAYEKKDNIITVMTAEEYEALYGRNFNEKRKAKSLKLLYAKPAGILAVLNEVKSDVGKVIVDEASGTIVLIDTPKELTLMEEVVNELDKPLATLVVELNYANTTDVQEYLNTLVTPNVGTVIVDSRTNKIIVSDFSERIRKIEQIVSALDEESRQVAIEAEIIQVTLNDEHQKGINWRRFFNADKDNLSFNLTMGTPASFTPSTLLSASNLRMSVGTFSRDNYDLVLQFLKTQGNTRIISRPRVVAVNNQPAKILVGTRQPYATESLSQAQSSSVRTETIEFIDVGMKLAVTPKIGKDGFITMKIKPEVSSVTGSFTSASNNTIPIVETSESETVVKVKDGAMLMLGGLIKEDNYDDTTEAPGLSKLPVVGSLFRSRAKRTKTSETVILLTPHILKGGRDDFERETIKAEKKKGADSKIWDKLKGLK